MNAELAQHNEGYNFPLEIAPLMLCQFSAFPLSRGIVLICILAGLNKEHADQSHEQCKHSKKPLCCD
jgi:hypothetical protein